MILKSTVRLPPPCTPRRAASAQAIAGHTIKLQQDRVLKIRRPERQGPPVLGDTYYKANDAAAYDDWVRPQALGLLLQLLVSGAQKQHVSSSCRGSKNNRLAGRVAYVWVRLPTATF